MNVEVKYKEYVCKATEQGSMSISRRRNSLMGSDLEHVVTVKIDEEKNRVWLTEIVCDNLRSFVETVLNEKFYPDMVVVVV